MINEPLSSLFPLPIHHEYGTCYASLFFVFSPSNCLHSSKHDNCYKNDELSSLLIPLFGANTRVNGWIYTLLFMFLHPKLNTLTHWKVSKDTRFLNYLIQPLCSFGHAMFACSFEWVSCLLISLLFSVHRCFSNSETALYDISTETKKKEEKKEWRLETR